LGVGDDGRSGAITLRILDDLRLATFHDRDTRVGGAQVDTDDLAHAVYSFEIGFMPIDGGGHSSYRSCQLSGGRGPPVQASPLTTTNAGRNKRSFNSQPFW